MTVLVVEDDRSTAHLVDLYLRREGYSVAICRDGACAVELALHSPPSLVILDVMLPGIDGLEFCHRVREAINVPIIFLTARTTEADRLRGFELGADDYVTKPFSPGELMARVRAVLRRYDSVENPPGHVWITVRELVINTRTRRVLVGGSDVRMTPVQYRLLCALAHEPGRTFTREMLVELALGPHYEGLERTIDAHIKNLRKLIEPSPSDPIYIQTVHGVGYRMAAEPGR
jgi:two-component system, OmpR family, alkaline phosphatase synthesis response regulator PhoP